MLFVISQLEFRFRYRYRTEPKSVVSVIHYVLVMKKLEIKKTKLTSIVSVLKVEYKVVLVSSNSNFFTNKTSLANKWMSFSSSYLALCPRKTPCIAVCRPGSERTH